MQLRFSRTQNKGSFSSDVLVYILPGDHISASQSKSIKASIVSNDICTDSSADSHKSQMEDLRSRLTTEKDEAVLEANSLT